MQLGHDRPSHILVPAIHLNRAEIREIFLREMGGADPALTDDPAALAEASRVHLRPKFLSARVAVSGANFAIAETGALCVVESEAMAACPDSAGHPDHRDGDREGGPAWRDRHGSRGRKRRSPRRGSAFDLPPSDNGASRLAVS